MGGSLGYSGTQKGMSRRQILALIEICRRDLPDEAHHGDCIGGDEEFHQIMCRLGCRRIVIHPPSDPKKRAFCKRRYAALAAQYGVEVVERPERPYKDRNHDVVDESSHMVFGPKTDAEELRSGTWATKRFTEKRRKPFEILAR